MKGGDLNSHLQELVANTIREGPNAITRLAELGLEPEDLEDSVLASETERRNCHPLEPAIAPGFKAWATGFRVLAERLTSRGWTARLSRLPRVLNPSGTMAIALLSGDESTGLPHSTPKSKFPRGIISADFVESNGNQLLLPYFLGMDPEEVVEPGAQGESLITWWLLIYSNGESLRAELSLPVGLGHDQKLSYWEERIILALPDLGPVPDFDSDDDDLPSDLVVAVHPL